MKILIVDDEPLARARLQSLIAAWHHSCQTAEAGNGIQALDSCRDWQPDVVLMDIRMPGMDGLQAAKALADIDDPPEVIFTTAYDDHALQAFDVQAIGYLVKPVNRDKLYQNLERVWQMLQPTSVSSEAQPMLSARMGNDTQVLALDRVLYFRAEQKYVVARHDAGELILEDTLKRLETVYAECFVRIHRNALVALKHIKSLHKQPDGQVVVRFLSVADELEVSRRHLPQLRKTIKARP